MSSLCKVVSFMNMKGGVGKTTLCVNLAYCLAREFKKKVLIIDFDPQANATQYTLSSDTFDMLLKDKRTIYQIYEDSISDYSMVYSSTYGDQQQEIDISPKKLLWIPKFGVNFFQLQM